MIGRKKKSLHKRTAVFLICAFVVLAISVIASIMMTMGGAVNEMESKYVKEHISRVENAIRQNTEYLDSVAYDWAAWDDTYEFVKGQNKAYETDNLSEVAYENLKIDVMAYIGRDGNYVFAKAMDGGNGELVPIYKDLYENLKTSGLLTNTDMNVKKQGIIMLDEGPLLFASQPIVRSNLSGPVAGNLIVGRLLDAEMVKGMGDSLKLQLAVERMDKKHKPLFDSISDKDPIIVENKNEHLVKAYSTITDIFGNKAIGIDISMGRDFSAMMKTSGGYMAVGLAVSSIVFVIIVSLFMEKNILRRLKRLSENVGEIGQAEAQLSRLPDEPLDDEISIVSDAVNTMLDKLEIAQHDLHSSEEKYRTFVENGRDIVFSVDLEGIVTYISPNCEEILGNKDEEIRGEPFIDIIHPDNHYDWITILQQADAACQYFYSYEFLAKSYGGEWQWFRTDISVLAEEGRSIALMGIFYNINEKKLAEIALQDAHDGLENEVRLRTLELIESNDNLASEVELRKLAQEKAERLAYYDHLTGLPNRLMLMNRLHQAIDLARRIEKPLGILFMDLDGFKMVNDTLGHDQGDELLKAVADRLSKIVRTSDTVARLGGDEFVIMAQNLEAADHIHTVAGKISEGFKQPFKLNDQEVYVTASIGISIFPADGETSDVLIKNADLAMYEAKGNGKNQHVFCTSVMKETVEENMKLTNGLYRALERNELEVYYQPQVCTGTQKIVGLEALLRWNHPELGLVPPGKFINLAEQTGLINPIGEWVLRDVCRRSKRWQEEGLPHVRVAVNLSIIQFQNPEIVSQIKGILEETQLSPEYLELEITESIAMRDTEFIVEVLNQFKELGLYISIDDFGTEFSSLKYLKLLPINKIKIPMPFIQGIDLDEKDEAITKTIIVLAKNMGMSVIAEGVETKQQESFLEQRMCDEMQGFYYYKPMPAAEIEAILKNDHETVQLERTGI